MSQMIQVPTVSRTLVGSLSCLALLRARAQAKSHASTFLFRYSTKGVLKTAGS